MPLRLPTPRPAATALAVASALALASTVLPGPLAARQDTTATGDSVRVPRTARLFRADEPVRMWMIADFKTIFKDRDTTSTKRFPAKLRYLDDKGDTLNLDVQLATRGHFRLKSSTCSHPPVKVHFDREQTRGGLFGGEGALKLSAHCQKGEKYAENTLMEYAINRMYALLTPVALRARLATITWIDPNDPKFEITRPGFWTEDEDEVAKQVRGKVQMTIGGSQDDMNPWQIALTEVFQYMIANTDFSLRFLHNYRIIQTDTSMFYLPMAYDFDWAGLVNAPYARPDYRLPIKRVTERLYRGACHPQDLLAKVFDHFRANKEGLYDILRKTPGLAPARVKESIDYLEEFYKVIDDPGRVRREFRGVCG